jgi:hypothetical protein
MAVAGTNQRLKEGFHQKFKTSDKLQICLYNQPFVLFFPKTVLNFSGSTRGQYFTIGEPVLHHPMSSTSPSRASTSPSIASNSPSGASTATKLSFPRKYSDLKENLGRPKKLCNAISVSLNLHAMKV